MNISFAWHNLWFEKGKLLLSVLGVAASLTLVILLIGLRDGLYSAVNAYLDNTPADLVVSQAGSRGALASSTIPAAIHAEIETTARSISVEHVLASDLIFVHGKLKMPAVIVGYNLDTGMGGPWNISEGRSVQSDNEITLDIWLARQADIQVGDQVDVLGRSFTVVGLTRETTSWLGPYLFVSRQAAEEVLQLPGIASFYLLRLPQGTDRAAVAEAIETNISGVDVLTPAQIGDARQRAVASVLDTPLKMLLLIGLVIGIAVIGLTTYTAVIDRVHEYGVLKAVGAGRGWLMGLVIQETLIRASLGFVFGIGLSYLTAQLIMSLFPQFTILIRLETIAWVALIALIMALFAALLPIRRVAAIDPVIVFKA